MQNKPERRCNLKNRIFITALLLLAMIGGWALRTWTTSEAGWLSDGERFGPSIEQLQPLSSLVTERVEVADVITSELQGITGGQQIVILVKGDVLIGTDLSQAKLEGVDPLARHATLILAEPTMASPRLDLLRTRVFRLAESGVWQLVPDSDRDELFLLNRGYAAAQQIVCDTGRQPEAVRRAKLQAEVTLASFFKAIGWDVAIRWAPTSLIERR